MGGIRIHNKKVSPIAKDATKIASLIASFKFASNFDNSLFNCSYLTFVVVLVLPVYSYPLGELLLVVHFVS